MSNVIPCSAPITLDGRPYLLRFRALAFIKYSGECGGDLLNDIRRIGSELAGAGESAAAGQVRIGAPLGALRDILWAGLVDAQPKITRDDVARMFGFRELGPIMEAITAALQLTMPEVEKAPERPTEALSLSPLINGLDSGHISESDSESAPATLSA